MTNNNKTPLQAQMDKAVESQMTAQRAAMIQQLAEATAVAPPAEKTTPEMREKLKMALEVVKAQPGRPPKDAMIRQLMAQKGMTRAQAKEQIKRFDLYMAHQFIQQQETARLAEAIDPSKAKTLTKAIFMGE